MFDFRKIEAFCKVYEQGSFSKAGEALFLSQPTVSAHIIALEKELEVRLLDRMGRTVLPTPAGEVLYRYAKQAFDRLEAAKAEINAIASEVTGELLIGSSNIPAHHVLPKAITGFLRKHPKVRPNLVVASSEVICRLVLEGEIMAGIVGASSLMESDLSLTPLLEDDIVIIAPPSMEGLPEPAPHGNGLSPLPVLSFEQACELPWILRESRSTTRHAFEDAMREAGYTPRLLRPRLVVDSAHAAVQYVEAGLGVAVAARLTVEDALERGTLRAFAIEGVHASRKFSCILNSRRVPFPAATVFLEYIQAEVQLSHSWNTDFAS